MEGTQSVLWMRVVFPGRIVTVIEARGKNLLIHFDTDPPGRDALVLHTHMRMNGVWRAYAPGAERPRLSGYVVVWLEVEARSNQCAPTAMRPMAEQLARLRRALEPEWPGD